MRVIKSSIPFKGGKKIIYMDGRASFINPDYVVNIFTDGITSWVASSRHASVNLAASRRRIVERATQGRVRGVQSISVYLKRR